MYCIRTGWHDSSVQKPTRGLSLIRVRISVAETGLRNTLLKVSREIVEYIYIYIYKHTHTHTHTHTQIWKCREKFQNSFGKYKIASVHSYNKAVDTYICVCI